VPAQRCVALPLFVLRGDVLTAYIIPCPPVELESRRAPLRADRVRRAATSVARISRVPIVRTIGVRTIAVCLAGVGVVPCRTALTGTRIRARSRVCFGCRRQDCRFLVRCRPDARPSAGAYFVPPESFSFGLSGITHLLRTFYLDRLPPGSRHTLPLPCPVSSDELPHVAPSTMVPRIPHWTSNAYENARPNRMATLARWVLSFRSFLRWRSHTEASSQVPSDGSAISPERPLYSLRSLGATGNSMSIQGWPGCRVVADS
jgi:hypothetical protein